MGSYSPNLGKNSEVSKISKTPKGSARSAPLHNGLMTMIFTVAGALKTMLHARVLVRTVTYILNFVELRISQQHDLKKAAFRGQFCRKPDSWLGLH